MKRFFTKVGRFFRSRGFLKFVLWAVTLVALFYAEEDWRGAHAWAVMKAKWEARGGVLDYAKFTPPPVPDAKNLGALPLFHVVEKRSTNGAFESHYLDDVDFRAGLRIGDGPDFDLPVVNGWIWGELPDLDKIRASLSAKYAAVFKKAPPADPRAQLEALFPFLPGLRAAAAERPFCRFAYDDTQILPASRGLELVTGQIRLARVLALDGILAVDQNQPDLALRDYATILKLKAGAESDPSLVGGLVGAAMFTMANGVIYEGLARHRWSDAQLVEIENLLEPLDFLAVYRFDMNAEAAVTTGNLDYFRNVRPSALIDAFGPVTEPPQSVDSLATLWKEVYIFAVKHGWDYYDLWPRGWFDLNKATTVNFLLNERAVVDEQGRRVDPDVSRKIQLEMDALRQSRRAFAPWNIIAAQMIGPLEKSSLQFCVAQVRVDETRIASALERYRLAHHAWPATLAELVPAQIAVLPRDMMNGRPYRYALRADGTFLLYSVGWNQQDDRGAVVLMPDIPGVNVPKRFDYENGDWPWPTSKSSAAP